MSTANINQGLKGLTVSESQDKTFGNAMCTQSPCTSNHYIGNNHPGSFGRIRWRNRGSDDRESTSLLLHITCGDTARDSFLGTSTPQRSMVPIPIHRFAPVNPF